MNKQQRAKFWCQVRCQSAFTGLLIIIDDWWMTMTRNNGLLCLAGNSQIIKNGKPLQCGQWFSLWGMRGGLFVSLSIDGSGWCGRYRVRGKEDIFLFAYWRKVNFIIIAFLKQLEAELNSCISSSFYIFSSFFCWWQASCIFCRAQRVGSKL